MSRRRPASHRTAPGDGAVVRDSVDRIVAEWAEERPDLPVAPIEVLARLARVRTLVDAELAQVFSRHDLSPADFSVIAALRRAGAPHALAQSALMTRLGLTSGTISVRLARLQDKGVVTRAPSADNARGVLVTLTAKGAELFDRVAPEHLANEDVLLSALTPPERTQLAGLLRKLLVAFEHEESTSPVGFTIAPAHLARRARKAVGLSDRAGLLVQHVDATGPAATAGLAPGDLIVGVDGQDDALVSCIELARATAAASADWPLRLRVVRGERVREVVLPMTGEDRATRTTSRGPG